MNGAISDVYFFVKVMYFFRVITKIMKWLLRSRILLMYLQSVHGQPHRPGQPFAAIPDAASQLGFQSVRSGSAGFRRGSELKTSFWASQMKVHDRPQLLFKKNIKKYLFISEIFYFQNYFNFFDFSEKVENPRFWEILNLMFFEIGQISEIISNFRRFRKNLIL